MLEQIVIHNKSQNRFEINMDGETAFVEYNPLKSGAWALPHTFGPPQFSGKGLASQLVKALLQYCKENQIKVIPQCCFVVKYIKRNSEWRALIVE